MEKTKVTETKAFTALMVVVLLTWYFTTLYLMFGSFSTAVRHTEFYILLAPFVYLVIDTAKKTIEKIKSRYKKVVQHDNEEV